MPPTPATQTAAAELPPLAAKLRATDPDRFLTLLFAPAQHRAALALLYAFDHELARARAVVSVAPLALIRLQWWREVIEGAARRHEVATPLSEALAAGVLDRADLLAMVAAREEEVAPDFADRSVWTAWLDAAHGTVAMAAARLLGAPVPEAARPAGIARGAVLVLTSLARQAHEGRCLLPRDAMTSAGFTPEQALAEPANPALGAMCAGLAGEMLAMPRPGRTLRGVGRAGRAAVLPLVLARRDLARIARAAPLAAERGLGDRLAVMRAGFTGL